MHSIVKQLMREKKGEKFKMPIHGLREKLMIRSFILEEKYHEREEKERLPWKVDFMLERVLAMKARQAKTLIIKIYSKRIE